jgi:hypothetical protein
VDRVSRKSLRRFLACAAAALVVVSSAVAAAASAPPRAASSAYQLSIGPIRSGGWKWSLDAFSSSAYSVLIVTASHKGSTGNHPVETHSWSIPLSAGDLTTDAKDLRPTTLSTGTDMSVYGSVDVKLTSPTPLNKRNVVCPATGKVLTKFLSRSGTFSGTIDFLPNASGLPTEVNVSSAPGWIEKYTDTGNSCPGGRGGCTSIRTFYGDITPTPGDSSDLNANTGKDFAWLDLSYSEYDLAHSVTITHDISADVPPSAVTITKSAVTIDGTSLAPLASGRLRFSLTKVSTSGTTCVRTRYTPTWVRGTITATFATATKAYTNPFDQLHASITKKV